MADYLNVPSLYDQIPGGFAISDTASAIAANIGSLNNSHINSITATGGTVTVSCATFLANQTTLDKVVGGFAISDMAAEISADLNQLTDSNITSINISDNAAVGVDVAELTSDAPQIGKLANANALPYQLAVTDSLPDIVGDLSGLDGNTHVASLTATSGSAKLSGGAVIDAPAFALTGSSTVLTLAEILTYSGSFSEGAGSTVSISTGDTLTLTGGSTLGGSVTGAGKLALAGGSTSINAGAQLTVANWTLAGVGTAVTLNENLTYAGTYWQGANPTLSIASGDTLTLTGLSWRGSSKGIGDFDITSLS